LAARWRDVLKMPIRALIQIKFARIFLAGAEIKRVAPR
jgi:hypothetical protein